jgi:hypothetical protein
MKKSALPGVGLGAWLGAIYSVIAIPACMVKENMLNIIADRF